MADVKLSQLAAASPASVAAGAALWTLPAHIHGLSLEWVAANQLRVTSGSAYIQSLGYAVNVPSAITKTGLTLTANTWYHVYLFMNGSSPDIELSTTAPAAAYNGYARSKTGAQTHRYLGSLRTTTAANTLAKFRMTMDGLVNYMEPFALYGGVVLSGGTATTPTNVDCSSLVPLTSVTALMNFSNTSNRNVVVANKDCNFTLALSGGWLFALNADSRLSGLVPLSTDQTFNYMLDPTFTSGNLLGIVYGYVFER